MPVTEYENHFDEIAREYERMAGLVVHKTIARIHDECIISFSLPKHGLRHGDHIASAPGEPPAIDTGNLANSMSHQMIGPHEGEVTVGAEYSVDLEMGGSGMAPRPYLGPAVEKVWPEFITAMEKIAPSVDGVP